MITIIKLIAVGFTLNFRLSIVDLSKTKKIDWQITNVIKFSVGIDGAHGSIVIELLAEASE